MVAGSQTAMGDSCARRLVFQSSHPGCNDRSVSLKWRAAERGAALFAFVHPAIGAHTIHHCGHYHAPVRSEPGTILVLPISAWGRARAASTLACAGQCL